LQDIKEQPKKESSVDQQTEKIKTWPSCVSEMTEATTNLLEHFQYEFVFQLKLEAHMSLYQ
jgi:hypothetical protein